MNNSFVPHQARILERIQESNTIFTLRLQLEPLEQQKRYNFQPGQFNMVYLYGVGEVPVSIVSDPHDDTILDHTIRAVGRVTQGLSALQVGDYIGIRGPYGRGWPLEKTVGQDVLIITGGLGCAPVVSVINYILRRRQQYGRMIIVQGVKHADDLIWRDRYEQWMALNDVEVIMAADTGSKNWPWLVGRVTQFCTRIDIDPDKTVVMMCGPEPMILASIDCLLGHGVTESSVWLSMERNMKCGIGQCGHCQLGDKFLCKQGPVFNYPEVKHLLSVRHL